MQAPSLSSIPRSAPLEHDARVREALNTILATARKEMQEKNIPPMENASPGNMEQGLDLVILNVERSNEIVLDCLRELARRWPAARFHFYSLHVDEPHVPGADRTTSYASLIEGAQHLKILGGSRVLMHGKSPVNTDYACQLKARMQPVQKGPSVSEAKLTDREAEILHLLSEGLLYKEISLRIGISEAAIKQHIHRMYGKLQVQNRTEAVNRFFGR